MITTITFNPGERVAFIFKKVTGMFNNKFSSQLLSIVLNSLTTVYIEKYKQAESLEDVEKVDEKLSTEIKTILKTQEITLSRDYDRLPPMSPLPFVQPYVPPYTDGIKRKPYDIICQYKLD